MAYLGFTPDAVGAVYPDILGHNGAFLIEVHVFSKLYRVSHGKVLWACGNEVNVLLRHSTQLMIPPVDGLAGLISRLAGYLSHHAGWCVWGECEGGRG